jgi:hypothetical protein
MKSRFSAAAAFCGSCLAPSRGLGLCETGTAKGRLYFGPVMWFCADSRCVAAMKETLAMPDDFFARRLDKAIERGRITAGHYALSVGKTDLAQMTTAEYHQFACVLVENVIESLRQMATPDRSGKDAGKA